MKKMILVLAVAVMAVFTVDAKDQGKSQAATHSNSPASADRHMGNQRAEVAGRGKKNGLKKQKRRGFWRRHGFWHRDGRH